MDILSTSVVTNRIYLYEAAIETWASNTTNFFKC